MTENKFLKINSSSLQYYTNNVVRNKKSSIHEIQRKMWRNMRLSFVYKIQKGKTWYVYGNLRFAVKDDEVVWIKNSQSAHPKWKKDMDMYDELSLQLGLKRTHRV